MANSGSVTDIVNRQKATGPLVSPAAVAQKTKLDVLLFDRNPFQKRDVSSPEMLADDPGLDDLGANIEAQGQLAPVVVRVKPGDTSRYELVLGHRRSEVFRRRHVAASSPDDKERWRYIWAEVRLVVSDVQMSELCIGENLQRLDLTPLEEAESFATHRSLMEQSRGESVSAEDLAQALNVAHDRVKRGLRLHEAPSVVKDAVRRSFVSVEVTDASGATKRRRKRIDLMAALEFAKLHRDLSAKKQTDLHPSRQPEVDRRVVQAMHAAADEGWSFQRVQEYVAATLEGRPRAEGAGKRTKPAYESDEKQLLVHKTRLAALDADGRDALARELEALLADLRGVQA